ncbi:MAG: hypothetical protein WCI18_09050 [Pseudomonadota bacterium]
MNRMEILFATSVLGLTLEGCRSAEESHLQNVVVSSVGASSSCDMQRALVGCFKIVLAKSTPIYPINDSDPNFDRDNCDFSGNLERSSGGVVTRWKAEAEKTQLPGSNAKKSGCLQAFVSPENPLMFKYFFRVTPSASGQINGTWEDVPLSSTSMATTKDLQWRVEPKMEKISSDGTCLANDRSSGQYMFNLQSNGKASIVVSFNNDKPTVLKYFGHVIENVSCNN